MKIVGEIHGGADPAAAHADRAGRQAGAGAAVVAHRPFVIGLAVDARAAQAGRVLGAAVAVVAGLAVVAGHRGALLVELVAARDVAAAGGRAGVRRADALGVLALIVDGAE